MKLSKNDQEILLSRGYFKEDLKQIEKAAEVTSYVLYEDEDDPGRSVSRAKVLAIMDRNTYLSGIGRSAFHFTSMRDTLDGRRVLFDSSRLFQ